MKPHQRKQARWFETFGCGSPKRSTKSPTESSPSSRRNSRIRNRVASPNPRKYFATRSVSTGASGSRNGASSVLTRPPSYSNLLILGDFAHVQRVGERPQCSPEVGGGDHVEHDVHVLVATGAAFPGRVTQKWFQAWSAGRLNRTRQPPVWSTMKRPTCIEELSSLAHSTNMWPWSIGKPRAVRASE